MNLQRIEKFNNELGAMLRQYQQVTQEQDNLNGMIQIAISMDDQGRAAKITEMLMENAPIATGIEKAAKEKANRGDIQGAVTLHTDIAIRIENANSLFESWRRQLAALELASAAGKITDENRAGVNEAVEDAKQQYELAIKLADQLVPNKATLLSLSHGIL